MAGDASLGITPVMKWNFERSCYRWLVTRHPAQFERLDFTAQILQSASRARKAFYECGWAEAKVLIRPSDGKFERTPFFDAIIRRGLRNSTRFDAATLTEEEIEALGMHRDETLGFKLQIRHFRSNRKELPPQGRARKPALPSPATAGRAAPPPPPGNVARPVSASNPAPPPRGGDGGGVGGGGAHASPLVVEQQPWRTESAAVARSPGDPRWAEEARWHRGVNGNGNGNGGPVVDGGGGGERWRAWEANRWVPGNDGPNAAAAADERSHHRYNGHNAGPPHAPPQHAPVSLVPPGLAHASSSATGVGAAHRVVWDGLAPGRGWGGLDRRPPPSWHPSAAAAAAAAAAAVEGAGERYERMGHNGVGPGDGGGRDGYDGTGGFRYHQSAMEQQQQQQHPGSGRSPSGVVGGMVNGPPPGFRLGSVGMDGGPGSPDSSPAGAGGAGGTGSLLSQGYRRLAAMADERSVGGAGGQPDAGRRTAPLAAVLNHARRHSPVRSSLPHHYEGAAENDPKRPLASGVVSNGSDSRGAVAGGVGHGQFSSRPLLPSPGREDGPAKKKQRPSVDGSERPIRANDGGSTQQQHADAPVKRSDSNDRRVQTTWPKDVGGASNPTPAGGHGDPLARETAESLRQLLAARDALHQAQARYEQATRAHNEVMAATGNQKQRSIQQQQQQQQRQQQQHERDEEGENTPDDCASLRSLARSCEAVAVSEKDTAAAAPASRVARGGGERQDGGGSGGGRVGRASDAPGAGDGNSDDGRDRVVPVVRRSSTAASGRTDKSEGAGRRSSSTGPSSSGRKSCSSGLGSSAAANAPAHADADADDDCADEMREVKLEAALLCGIGRAPARRSAAPTSSATAVADKGLGIVSLAAAAAAANAPSGDNYKRKAASGGDTAAPRSSSSSPGGIRGGGGGTLSRTSSAPHLPSLSIRRHHSSDGGGGGGGGGGGFRRPSSDSHPMDRDRATRGHGGSGGGNTLPPMAQMPGSPSACGETDSDHSDSMGGGGGEDPAAESKQHQRRRAHLVGGSHGLGFSSSSSKAPSSTGRDSWPGYSRRGRHVAGSRDNEGLSCA